MQLHYYSEAPTLLTSILVLDWMAHFFLISVDLQQAKQIIYHRDNVPLVQTYFLYFFHLNKNPNSPSSYICREVGLRMFM